MSRVARWINQKIEGILMAFVFIAIWAFVFRFASFPDNVDMLAYSNLALNPEPDGEMLFRWTHIYLQKPFLQLFEQPIYGIRLFTGFLLASTTVLVFLCGKMLFARSNSFNGVAAILFFISGNLLLYSNENYSDFTAMMFLVLGLWIYLYWRRSETPRQHGLLTLLGLVFLVALKSKETGIVVGGLFWGLGHDFEGDFSFRRLFYNLLPVFSGILFGTLLFIALDGFFLGDALYSFRRASIDAYSLHYLGTTDLIGGAKTMVYSWYALLDLFLNREARHWADLALSRFTLPILLSLAALFRPRRPRLNWPSLTPWSLPLAIYLLLVFGSVEREPWHLYPAFPIIAITAANSFNTMPSLDLKVPWEKFIVVVQHKETWVGLALIGGYGLARYGFDISEIYKGLIFLVASLVLIILATTGGRNSSRVHFVLVGALLAYSSYAILFETTLPMVSNEREARLSSRYTPLISIARMIDCSEDFLIYISTRVPSEIGVFYFGRTENQQLLNTLFGCSLSRSHVTIVSPEDAFDELAPPILYRYIFISESEYMSLDQLTKQFLEDTYLATEFEKNILFLSAREY